MRKSATSCPLRCGMRPWAEKSTPACGRCRCSWAIIRRARKPHSRSRWRWSIIGQSSGWRVTTTTMPPLLNRLIRHGRAGYLLRAGTLLDAQLAAATQLAQDRLARRPLCFKGQASRQGKILLTVVQSFFVWQVQPWAADVSRIHYQALAAHRQL
ncbi:MAG TPA: hypothetical protein DD979_01310, partial [Gammaproteobacteria bacterium]|nr:hypothetical protein [Gammaproteobacteria bacterium]